MISQGKYAGEPNIKCTCPSSHSPCVLPSYCSASSTYMYIYVYTHTHTHTHIFLRHPLKAEPCPSHLALHTPLSLHLRDCASPAPRESLLLVELILFHALPINHHSCTARAPLEVWQQGC